MTEPTVLRDITVVTTTVATEAEARQLAQLVLQARLAACVQVEPITAYFPWQGALQEERDFGWCTKPHPGPFIRCWLSCGRTILMCYPSLVVQTLQGSAEYADWVDAQVAHAVVSA